MRSEESAVGFAHTKEPVFAQLRKPCEFCLLKAELFGDSNSQRGRDGSTRQGHAEGGAGAAAQSRVSAAEADLL